MTKLNKTIVKKTLVNLNLKTILRLLLKYKKDYQLFSGNDVNSPRKELSIHRQALIDYIVDTNNEDSEKIYEEAKAIADPLAVYVENNESIKGEIKPLQDELKVKKAQLKKSNEDTESFIEEQANELYKTLDDVAKNKLVQYNVLVEKVAAKSKNKKQMEKGKKEFGSNPEELLF